MEEEKGKNGWCYQQTDGKWTPFPEDIDEEIKKSDKDNLLIKQISLNNETYFVFIKKLAMVKKTTNEKFLIRQGMPIPYRWAFRRGPSFDNKMELYTDELNDKINAAFTAGNPDTKFSSNSNVYFLDFRNMTQTNVETGFQREVQKMDLNTFPKPPDASHTWYFWEGNPSSGRFMPFDVSTSLVLEQEYEKKGKVNYKVKNYSYEADLANMFQTNLETLVRRKIYRGVPPAIKPEKVRWEFLDSERGEERHYTSYKPADNASIEAAYVAGNFTVQLNCGFYTYTINFRELIQINDATGTIRAVRRIIEAPGISSESKEEKKSAPKDLPGTSGSADSSICKICYINPACIVINPCGHFGVCEACSSKLSDLCPFCKVPIHSKIKIFKL